MVQVGAVLAEIDDAAKASGSASGFGFGESQDTPSQLWRSKRRKRRRLALKTPLADTPTSDARRSADGRGSEPGTGAAFEGSGSGGRITKQDVVKHCGHQ